MAIQHYFVINKGFIQRPKGQGQISRSNCPDFKKNAENMHILISFVPLFTGIEFNVI